MSERSTEIVGKFGFVKTNIFDQTIKMWVILKKNSPQSEPHGAKLCFSVV